MAAITLTWQANQIFFHFFLFITDESIEYVSHFEDAMIIKVYFETSEKGWVYLNRLGISFVLICYVVLIPFHYNEYTVYKFYNQS